jgi:hypothetical protein
MHRRVTVCAWLVLGCSPDEGPRGLATPSPEPQTSLTLSADGMRATCLPQPDNALRFDCQITLDTPANAAISIAAPDGLERVLHSDAGVATVHDLTLWGMRPETPYTWTLLVDGEFGPSGTLLTEALPDALSGLQITKTGTDPVVDHLAFAATCGGQNYALIVGTDGAVLWYQPFEGRGTTLNITDDDTVILQAGNAILEYDMAGELRLELTESEVTRPIHHDVHKFDGHIYVLFADAYPVGDQQAVLDGIAVFDSSGSEVATWELFDHISLTADDLTEASDRFWAEDFPEALDFSHGNSVFADASGIYLSTRWISTVWKLKGLDDAAFGEVEWHLTGELSSPIEPDLALSSTITETVNFSGQHHATIAPDGTLTLFDNRSLPETSRGLVIEVDPGAGQAAIIGEHALPVQCNIQGGLFRLDNGDAVATCATTATSYHFRASTPTPGFTLSASCDSEAGGGPGGGRPATARMQPFDL